MDKKLALFWLLLAVPQGFGSIVLEREPGKFYLVVQQGGKVLYQSCLGYQPKTPELREELDQCQEVSGQKPYTVSANEFFSSLQSLYGVPYRKTGIGALREATHRAIEQQRGRNTTGESQEILDRDYGRLLKADRDFLSFLGEEEKRIPNSDKLSIDIVTRAFSPVFSDGEIIFRLDPAVPASLFQKSCEGMWVRSSVSTLLSSSDILGFIDWAKTRFSGGPILSVWAWHYWVESTPVGNVPAFTDQKKVLELALNPILADAKIPARSELAVWVKPWEKLAPGNLSLSADDKRFPVLCYRRSLPEALEHSKNPATGISMAQLMQKYQIEAWDTFRVRVLSSSVLDRAFGARWYVSEDQAVLSESELDQATFYLDALFRPELVRMATVRKRLAAELAARNKKIADDARELAEAEKIFTNSKAEYEKAYTLWQGMVNSTVTAWNSYGYRGDANGEMRERLRLISVSERNYERAKVQQKWAEEHLQEVRTKRALSSSSAKMSSGPFGQSSGL